MSSPVNTPSSVQKDERIDLRLTSEQKEHFLSAARLESKNLSEFVIECVSQRATELLRDLEVLRLSRRDAERFIAAVDAAFKPNDALVDLLRDHQDAVAKGQLESA